MKTTLRIALAVMMIGVPAVAGAQMKGAPKAGTTRAAAMAAAAKQFARFDQNGDGTVDATEASAVLQARATKSGKTFKPKRAARFISRNDGNGDGKVTLAEFQTAASGAFDKADTNKNGTIDADEAPSSAGGGADAGDGSGD